MSWQGLPIPGFRRKIVAPPSVEEWKDLLYRLSREKPSLYDIISLDASTARDNQEYVIAGDFISIERHYSTVPFFIRLNEPDFPLLDLSRHRSITAPFYRIFITNKAGNGNVVLKIGRGIRLEAELFGVEELANRIIFNTPMTFDQRGQLLWADNFEDNINKWIQEISGASGAIALSTEEARSGAKSCKLTVGPGFDFGTQITHGFPPPIFSKFGFEYSFTVLFKTTGKVFISSGIQIGPPSYLSYVGVVEYRFAEQVFRYLNSDFEYITFATTPLDSLEHGFHTWKLVIDCASKKYVRVIIDNEVTDLSSYLLPSETKPPTYLAILWVRAGLVTTTPGDVLSNYVDDAIITQNEP